MSDPYAALRDRIWYPNYPMEGRDMNHDLRDESLIRQQSQRLAQQQSLVGLEYPAVPLFHHRTLLIGLLVIASPVLLAIGLLGMAGWL